MKRRTGSVRLWAAAFWLLVWEGASLALAATTGGRMLLLASPVQALGRLLALAGTAAFWQAVAFSNSSTTETFAQPLGRRSSITAARASAASRVSPSVALSMRSVGMRS